MSDASTPVSTLSIALALLLATMAPARASPDYFGAQPPDTPQPFAPPHLATSVANRPTCLAFSPDRRLVAVSAMDAGADGKVATYVHETRLAGGQWSSPSRVASLGPHPGGEAAFSPDGRWLYFSSDRPPGGPWRPRAFRAPVKDARIGAPELVHLDVAPDAGVYYPRLLPNGDFLFTSRGQAGSDDLFIARARGDGFDPPESLGGDFNTPKDDWDLVESPDGRLRIWVSAREKGPTYSKGRTDLFYSRLGNDGAWSPAANLAAANTTSLETAPSLTPDGKGLFFLRREHGTDRMYWVRLAAVLEE